MAAEGKDEHKQLEKAEVHLQCQHTSAYVNIRQHTSAREKDEPKQLEKAEMHLEERGVKIHISTCIYIHMYMYTCIQRDRERSAIYIYIHIYIERERKREREWTKRAELGGRAHICMHA